MWLRASCIGTERKYESLIWVRVSVEGEVHVPLGGWHGVSSVMRSLEGGGVVEETGVSCSDSSESWEVSTSVGEGGFCSWIGSMITCSSRMSGSWYSSRLALMLSAFCLCIVDFFDFVASTSPGLGPQTPGAGISVGLGLRVTLVCVGLGFLSFAMTGAQVGDMTTGILTAIEDSALGLPFTTDRQI